MIRLFNDSDTVISIGNGRGVVLILLDEYNSFKETEYIMSSQQTMEAIRKGENDIKTGNVISQKECKSIGDFLQRISCIK